MGYWNDIEQIACSTKWLCSATKNLYGMKVCQSFTTLKTGQKFQSHPFAVPIPWEDKSALHLPSSPPPSLDLCMQICSSFLITDDYRICNAIIVQPNPYLFDLQASKNIVRPRQCADSPVRACTIYLP